jgi:hypothetical protein
VTDRIQNKTQIKILIFLFEEKGQNQNEKNRKEKSLNRIFLKYMRNYIRSNYIKKLKSYIMNKGLLEHSVLIEEFKYMRTLSNFVILTIKISIFFLKLNYSLEFELLLKNSISISTLYFWRLKSLTIKAR